MSSYFATVILPVKTPSPLFIKTCQSVLSSNSIGELIIIDDNNDQSPIKLPSSIDSDSRVRLIQNKRTSGISGALNTGILSSRFDFIARIDDGDIWIDPTRISKSISLLRDNPDYDLICSSMFTSYGGVAKAELSYFNNIPTPFIRVPHPTWVLKKSSIKHLYRECNVLRFEDYAFLLDNSPLILILHQIDTFYDTHTNLKFGSELHVAFRKSQFFHFSAGSSFLSFLISASYVFLRSVRLLLTRKKVR